MHSRPIKHRGGPIGGPGRRHPAQQRKRWAKQLQGRMRDAGLAIARHVHAVLHLLLATPPPPPLAPPRRTPEPWAAESPREFGADRAPRPRTDASRAGTTTTRGRRGGAPPRLAVSHAPTGPTTRSPRTPTLHPAAAAARSLAARAPGTGSWLVAHLLPRKATPTPLPPSNK